MKSDMMYDYMNIIDKTPPPGAEGDNQGNGNANQYLDTSSPHVPVDSKLSTDEQRVLDEANGGKKKAESLSPQKPPEEKKKKGFFKRLFGGK
jgi:penicillin-binding protein 1A